MTCSSPDFAAPFAVVVPSCEVMFGSEFSFAGEMGMVSSGTGELGLSVVDAVREVDMAGVTSFKGKLEVVSPSQRVGEWDPGCTEALVNLAVTQATRSLQPTRLVVSFLVRNEGKNSRSVGMVRRTKGCTGQYTIQDCLQKFHLTHLGSFKVRLSKRPAVSAISRVNVYPLPDMTSLITFQVLVVPRGQEQ